MSRLSTVAFLVALVQVHAFDRGLNLPPTQGTTRDGAFFPGVYSYEYKPDQVSSALHQAGFSAVRLGINAETAQNDTMLQRYKEYIDAVGGHGLICMFDTATQPGASQPRSGRVTNWEGMVRGWQNIHGVFASYGDAVRYEILNEPWGYQNNAAWYVRDMRSIIEKAGLPEDRCVLAGLYGSADIQSVANAGWQGLLALHWYTFYVAEGQRTAETFSTRIQQSMQGISSRVFITEFGTGLDNLTADVDAEEVQWDLGRAEQQQRKTVSEDWGDEDQQSSEAMQKMCETHPKHIWCRTHLNSSSDDQHGEQGAEELDLRQQRSLINRQPKQSYQDDSMAFLRGLRDALSTVKRQGNGIQGLYHWHGWHNGDTWDFWDAANAQTSRMIQLIMSDLAEADGQKDAQPAIAQDFDAWSADYIKDDQQVHMMTLGTSGPLPAGQCPKECAAPSCAPGNEQQIGGKHMTGGSCTHTCSIPYGGTRFCGAGEQYETPGAIDCGACARPARCYGLPCWSSLRAVKAHSSKTRHAKAKKHKVHAVVPALRATHAKKKKHAQQQKHA